MEKRLAIAIALCVGFMVLWTWMFPPGTPPPPEPTVMEGSGAAGAATATGQAAPVPAGASSDPVMAAGTSAATTAQPVAGGSVEAAAPERAGLLPVEAASATAEEETAVDTPLHSIRLSNRGGRITSWKLLAYHDAKGEPLDLVSPAARKLDRMPLDLGLEDEPAATALRAALFRVEREEREDQGRRFTVVTFTYSDGQGTAATKVLKIDPSSYVAEIEVAAEIQGRPVQPGIVWGAGFESDEAAGSAGMGVGTRAVLNQGGKIEQRYQDAIKGDAAWNESGAIAWAGLENKYFAAIFVPQGGGLTTTRVESLRLVEEGREQHHLLLTLQAAGATHYRLFAGPKDYDVLKSIGLGLDRLLDFGFFGVIALPLFYALKFVYRYVGNYGWAIVVLTVFIRLLFFPFMHRSQLKMRVMQEKMKRIQPKLKALRERYAKLERKEVQKGTAGGRQKVRQEMNEEMMGLYREEGINPFSSMSGCLPLLAQMPILYGFYTILTIAIDLRQAPFLLWVHDLSLKDPYYVTPILMGATMLIQQVMTSSAIADVAQRRMMYVMPVMFTWFFINLPSGLVLYWLVNNLLGIVQQYLVNREADAQQIAAAAT